MDQLHIMLGMGSLLLLLFLAALAVQTISSYSKEPAPPHPATAQMLFLPALSFPHARLLLDRGDYEFLLRGPSVAVIARDLLRDRKQLVNMWLRAMQKDILTLWRFRRLLAQHGATATFAEELAVVFSALTMLSMLLILRLGVALVGPFVLMVILRAAPRPAEFIRQTCSRAAFQLSEARFAEVRSAWQST